MLDDVLRSRLKEATEDVMIDTQAEETKEESAVSDDGILEATNVMASYQNANKWLDIIKESLLMDFGCVFFSNYVHNLAHTMPARFDKFGDILHTIDKKVPYPATEYIDSEPTDVPQAFEKIFMILDCICDSLCKFIEVAPTKAVAIATENLLQDISGEYTNLRRMRRAYDAAGDVIKFDKWCAQYINNLGTLID